MRRLRPLGVLAALSLALAGLFAPRLAAVVADPLAGQKQASGQHGSAHEASVNEDPAGARDVRLDCVSYSPYRHPGTSPWQPGVARLEQTLERDLRQLSTITGCVRTYGTSGGLDQVPAIAKRLGMTVWLGAWIGREAERNAQEIETAIALARRYPGVVQRVIVGSETLLRAEQSPQDLAALILRARAQSPVPVAYADVWEFWLAHAATLAPVVDEALVHILPYWENSPVGIDQAVDHVLGTWTRMRHALAPLPVLIGETGWPAGGRPRAAAVPGVAQQTRFVQQLLARSSEHPPLPVNIVEAYDQPWKFVFEGVAGATWGLFDVSAHLRLGSTPAMEARHWLSQAILAAALGAAAALFIAAGRLGFRFATAIVTVAGADLGVLVLLQYREMAWLDPGSGPWLARAVIAIGSTVWAALAVAQLLAACRTSTRAACPISTTAACKTGIPGLSLQRLAEPIHRLGAVAITFYGLALLLDGRYRDLAWPSLAAPVLPWVLSRMVQGPSARAPRSQRVLAAVLAITGLAVTIRESVLFDTGNLEAGLAHLAAGLFATNGAALGVGALMLAAAAALSLGAGPVRAIGSEPR